MSYSLSLDSDPKELLASALRADGLVSRFISGFEERPQQIQMALAVWESITEDKHLLVEAGTGVGKSLAYLLPAALLADRTKQRTVISTHTVNLQEQLASKDIPLVAKVLDHFGFDLKFGLMKGRTHYVCLRKLKQATVDSQQRTQLMLPGPEDKAIAAIDDLVRQGQWDGDRDNLPFAVPEALWLQVASESGRCMATKCPEWDKCPYQAHRKALEKCHLIVVNHALFVSHISLLTETNGAVRLLPAFETAIFDEAHHLEDVTRDALGVEVSQARFKRLVDDTVRLSSRGNLASILTTEEQRRVKAILEDHLAALGGALRSLEPERFSREKNRIRTPQGIDEGFIESLAQFSNTLEDWESMDLSDEDRFEVGALKRRFNQVVSDLVSICNLEGDGDSYVYWTEKDGVGRRGSVVAKRAPLEVGPYLAVKVWDQLGAAVLTSATLSIGGSMEYVKRMLNLHDAEELVLGSPFDYGQQACLCIPNDNRGLDVNSDAFDQYVAGRVLEIVNMAQGRTFVLFTSRKSMDAVSLLVRDSIEERGFPFLKQGEAPRDALLAEFRQRGNAVLFGLASFWEGVDVPGSALSCVVLAKMPFPVPDDPLMEAREESWKAQGLSPFTHYSLPQAILKLKQGFGRLVRSKSDRGAVVLLDPRILYKSYGKTVLKSLPPARLTRDVDDVARAVAPMAPPRQ